MRPVFKPVQAESEIASAKGRVKPLTRLLRCATALPGDSAPRLRLRRLVWPKGSFPAQQARPECPGLWCDAIERYQMRYKITGLRGFFASAALD